MSKRNTGSPAADDRAILHGRRLRLLIVTQHFPSLANPTHAMYNMQQYKALSALFDIKILVPVDWIFSMRHGKRALSGDSPLDVSYVPYFYTPKILRSFGPKFMDLSIGVKFRRLLQWRPDAVLACWAFPDAVAVRSLLGESDLPFFGQVLGSDVNVHGQLPSRRRQIVEAFNSAAAVFSVSADLRARLLSCGVDPERVVVVYNGVDDSRFFPVDRACARRSLDLPADSRILLFVGNLKEPKGPFDLLEAVRLLAERGRLTDTMLVYVGGGEGATRLASMGAALEEKHPGIRVLVGGSAPHEQINQWMNAADFVCLPSHNEGVPNVVLEAMRCGVPVIASDVGGIPEVLDPRCGVMAPAKDVEAIAAGIERACEIEWNRRAIREYSQKFQWKDNAERVYQVISQAEND